MSTLTAVLRHVCLVFLFAASVGSAAEPADSDESETGQLAPGVRIERVAPDADAETARARLRAWRTVYSNRLAALRRSAGALFSELERSSLATLTDSCRDLLARAGEVDRRGLFASADVELDRMLFGSLERFRAGSAECLAGRYFSAYRLLLEATTGLAWIDRRIERRLRPPVRLRGLDFPD